MTATVFG